MVGMGINAELKKLRWKCRRGMKELDALLLHYLDRHYSQAKQTHKNAFELLLNMQDPELYFLVLGKKTSDDQDIAYVINELQSAPRT